MTPDLKLSDQAILGPLQARWPELTFALKRGPNNMAHLLCNKEVMPGTSFNEQTAQTSAEKLGHEFVHKRLSDWLSAVMEAHLLRKQVAK